MRWEYKNYKEGDGKHGRKTGGDKSVRANSDDRRCDRRGVRCNNGRGDGNAGGGDSAMKKEDVVCCGLRNPADFDAEKERERADFAMMILLATMVLKGGLPIKTEKIERLREVLNDIIESTTGAEGEK